MLRTVTATRYVAPLREGGSLPGLMEADDLGTYVVKYTGAGQGRKALVAEVVCAGIARALGLDVPELVLVEVDPLLGRSEPDQEVQELLLASPGTNLGSDFLPGSLGFDPLAHRLDPGLAATVLWFDALVGNVDRSWRNPNLLMWHRALWLIDHGACLTFHHAWDRSASWATKPYDTADHVLRDQAGPVTSHAVRLDAATLESVIADVPDAWLEPEERPRYVEQLTARLTAEEAWRP